MVSPRQAYKVAAGAYRARARKVWSASMTYEARPLNASEASERSQRDAYISALPDAAMPTGFSRPQTRDVLACRALWRQHKCERIGEIKRELERRAEADKWHRKAGIASVAPYVTSTKRLHDELARLRTAA